MKRKTIFYNAALIIAALAIVVTACKKDNDDNDGPTSFTLKTLSAGSIDMNGATPPTDVPGRDPDPGGRGDAAAGLRRGLRRHR